jgi:DNA polymerase-3 subunit alpha
MSFGNSFIHLHIHSAYSLAEGALKIPDLIGLCQNNNMPAVAVTDTNNLFGALEFAIYASKGGIQPIIGCQVQLGLEGHQLVLLVQSEKGYRNLCKLVSQSYMEGDDTHEPYIDIDDLKDSSEGLICLTGGVEGPVSQYILHNQVKKSEEILKLLKKIFPESLYIELQRHGTREEKVVEDKLLDLAYKHNVPLVATNNCYFPKREMYEAHDALLCIADGRYITEENRRKVTPEHYFKSSEEMRELFSDIPEAIDNTLLIAKRCHFLLKTIDPILPPFETEGGRTEIEELKVQAKEGLNWRLNNFVFTDDMDEQTRKDVAKPYYERLEFELDVIIDMGFPGYFLICSDFIKWAKEHNIAVGPARGSGAGSVVAWVLLITDLDPLKFGLLFERFLNPERVSMPDFDVDFCQSRRDEVISYVQDKYGHGSVAQIITFGKLQARAVVRDVGRVLQMPYGQVDRIAKMIPNNPANPMSLEEALIQDKDLRNERRKDETTDKLITIALQLEGLYRHASTHAAGVVIGDRPLQELVPLYRDPRSDMPVTQLNMKYVEQAGLVKFDFLGLKTMTVIQKSLEIIKESKGKDIDHLKIPFDDKETYNMLTHGLTTGVFQLESAGMRDVMCKMKPNRLEDIIALVALYRPGPMDNIPRYIAIKNGLEEPDYMHPKLQPILEETYGIMIYQEQVMQAAQLLAGYTLGGADLLRRAMGKKIKEEMDAQREMFVSGCKEHNDIDADKANEIFDQIAKFAGYGFNKSHAAAYAVIAYWTAWLKANYPVEFMTASMTLDMGNTDKLSIFKQALDRMKIKLLPPCINNSNTDFIVEEESIRYALAALKGVGEGATDALVKEREENGNFKDLDDFINRVDTASMNRRQFDNLVCAGAFDVIASNRAQLMGGSELLLRYAVTLSNEKSSGQSSLFGAESGTEEIKMPPLPDIPEWDQLEKLRREFASIGFYISAHPLDMKAEQLKRLGIVQMSEVSEKLANRNSAMIEMAGVLTRKQIKMSQKGSKFAFLQISDASGVYEITVFSETIHSAQDILVVGETLLLKVIAEQKEDQIRYTTQSISKLDDALDSKIKEIHIHLDKEEPVSELKKILDGEGKGNVKICLMVPLSGNSHAEIFLPQKWSFSSNTRDMITSLNGVNHILEI